MLKSLRFFKKKPQFRNSGKVLLSRSFITCMRASGKTYEHQISMILGRKKVTFLTTSCAIKAVDFADQVCDEALKKMKISITSCCHRAKCSELQCIKFAVTGGNEEGLFVATNEGDQIQQLQEMQAVPVISCFGNQIVLKQVSEVQELSEDGAHGPGNNHGGRHGGRQAGIGRDHRARGRAI